VRKVKGGGKIKEMKAAPAGTCVTKKMGGFYHKRAYQIENTTKDKPSP